VSHPDRILRRFLYRLSITSLILAGSPGNGAVPGSATQAVTTTGTLHFHLLLGAGSATDSLVLDGGNYDDLILSNLIAGVMYGHLVTSRYPGIQFNKDYLYGSLMGQLLQENIETEAYTAGQDLIDPSPAQQAVMGVGQGGPYQINNYAVDMVSGTYAPQGHALIDFVALRKNIGYSLAGAATQYRKATPPSFNNKYFGPMLAAYFQFNDLVAMDSIGKGAGGWQTPWEPALDNAMIRFRTLPGAFLDILMNAAYNQGFYGQLLGSYCLLGESATAATVASVDSFAPVWGSTDSYRQYPYQVRYYLDQLFDLPTPTTSPAALVVPDNHLAVPMGTLGAVFSQVCQTLAHLNAAGQEVCLTSAQADGAFQAGLASAGVASTATLDLASAPDRGAIFTLLEGAIASLETSLGFHFSDTSQGPAPASVTVQVSPARATLAPGATQTFTAAVEGTANPAVSWSAPGGTISTAGLYTAPARTGSYVVTATSLADTTASASAAVTVQAPPTPGAGITLTLARTSAWAGGYEATFRITNQGSTAISGWTLAFATTDSLSGFYNVEATRSGQTFKVLPLSWDTTIAPGAWVQFGFGGNYAGASWNPPLIAYFNGIAMTVSGSQARLAKGLPVRVLGDGQ